MEHHSPLPRRRYTAEQRVSLVALYRQSHLTQSEFARQHGLKLCTFQQWLYAKAVPISPPSFKEVFLPAAPLTEPAAVEIILGTDLHLKLRSAVNSKFLAQLIKSLRRSC